MFAAVFVQFGTQLSGLKPNVSDRSNNMLGISSPKVGFATTSERRASTKVDLDENSPFFSITLPRSLCRQTSTDLDESNVETRLISNAYVWIEQMTPFCTLARPPFCPALIFQNLFLTPMTNQVCLVSWWVFVWLWGCLWQKPYALGVFWETYIYSKQYTYIASKHQTLHDDDDNLHWTWLLHTSFGDLGHSDVGKGKQVAASCILMVGSCILMVGSYPIPRWEAGGF